MNKENAHLYLPLVQALKDGKTVQITNSLSKPDWHDCQNLDFSCDPRCYRIKPWTLEPPPEGESWHRTDWTEEMLPPVTDGGLPRRPLLKGEDEQECDEWSNDDRWESCDGCASKAENFKLDIHRRTRRPLPAKPKLVPLEAGDVPPGSVFRWHNWTAASYRTPLEVYESTGVMMIRGGEIKPHSWDELKEDGWLIKRPGSADWQPCSKEEKP